MYDIIGVTVSDVKIVQCMIFRWNPWTTNWIRHVWSSGAANFGTQCRTHLLSTLPQGL